MAQHSVRIESVRHMLIGERIRKLRVTHNMSMSDLAREVDVSPASVNNWENHGAFPRQEKIGLLASIFSVSEEYLVDGIEEAEQSFEEIMEEAKSKLAKFLGISKSKFELEIRYRK